MILERLTIDKRFCGPPDTGNGGYVAGLLARHVAGTTEVALRAPAPLETELRIETQDSDRDDGERVALLDGETILATARRGVLDLESPAPPDYATAVATAGTCRAFATHPFPRCFVSGPDREAGDGLRILPGVLEGSDVVAAPWIPDASLADEAGSVRHEFLWAALDTPSSFPLLEDPEARRLEPMVLGRLTAAISGALHPGERCVVIAWPLSLEGRRGYAGSAIFSESGERIALARATWVSLSVKD
jgi:hypothetical protein